MSPARSYHAYGGLRKTAGITWRDRRHQEGTPLRCSRCGSEEGFIIKPLGSKAPGVRNDRVPLSSLLQKTDVTCTYCNNRWEFVPYEPPKPGPPPEPRKRGRSGKFAPSP